MISVDIALRSGWGVAPSQEDLVGVRSAPRALQKPCGSTSGWISWALKQHTAEVTVRDLVSGEAVSPERRSRWSGVFTKNDCEKRIQGSGRRITADILESSLRRKLNVFRERRKDGEIPSGVDAVPIYCVT